MAPDEVFGKATTTACGRGNAGSVLSGFLALVSHAGLQQWANCAGLLFGSVFSELAGYGFWTQGLHLAHLGGQI